jgi:hypothetical protein
MPMEYYNKVCVCFIVKILAISNSYMDPMQWHSANTWGHTREKT